MNSDMGFVPVLRFMVTSDVHTHSEESKESERFALALATSYDLAAKSSKYKGLDAVYVVGDFSDNGCEKQMKLFKRMLDEGIGKGTEVTLTLASHEFKSDGGEQGALERFDSIFKMPPDTHKVINGFHFIAVTTTNGCRFSDEKRAFIARELAVAAKDDPKKPIFFFQHPHITDTVCGSINWGEDEITDILMNYPQIIDFSGHSHAPINDPRSIHQRHFTAVGTGSLSYFELDEFDKVYGTVPPLKDVCAQITFVEVSADNRVRLYPYDLITGNFFPQLRCVDCPCEPSTFIYTDARYKTDKKPFFKNGSWARVEQQDKTCCLITFTQATIDEDYVDDYKIVIRRKSDGAIVRQLCLWSYYYLYNMPDTVSQSIEGLEPGNYRAEIFANSFWKTTSDKPLETDFSVK